MAEPNGGNDHSENGGNGHERLLKGLLDSVNDLVWCTSIDGTKLLYVNPAAERIYGRPMAEMIENQDVWWESIFPDDRPAVQKNLAELLQRGQIVQEYRIVRPDGELRWLQDRITVICDESGKPVRVGGIGTDVTARKLAEKALSDSEVIYHSLVENLPLNVLRKDLDGRVAFGNQRYCETLDRTLDELIGKTDFDLFPEELAKKYVEDDRRVIEGGDVLHEVEEHHTQDGKRIFVEVFKSPVQNVEGEIVGVQVMFWDVTERKRAQKQLQAAKEAADAANRAKSDFLANMSHEIRTPMNAVIGMTELLLDTRLDVSQREYVRMVGESGESLLELINDILDFSKIEAGKFELESVPFSLQDSLGDTMKSLSIRAHRKNLELAFHIAPDVPDGLLGDPGRLRQIVINLVGNAVKFTEAGEVVVRVRCVSRSDEFAELQFSVIDTGIGIAEDKLDHIFGAFEQADASTTRRFGGTGLGLAISARIVEMMQGEIGVDSTPGEGSTFRFTARFGLAESAAPQPMAHLEQMAGMRVLVVDDNATNRRILEEMLQVRGMRPVLAASAGEALQKLRAVKADDGGFALILTDVNMPDVDGLTMVEQIRRDDALKDVEIIVLTSGDRPGDRQRCRDLGVAAHLMKPIKQSELFDAIVVACGNSSQPSTAASHTLAELPRVRPLQILLAEDARANQILAVGLLKKWDHTVTVANNGREAVRLAQSQPFDVVLMDVQMPELDGLDATRAIRKLEAEQRLPADNPPHIPIVAMTAHALKGDRERCLEAGMDEYVSKPIRVRELAATLHRLFPGTASTEKEPATAGGGVVVDWSFALGCVAGDRELLIAVCGAFLEECPGHRRALTAAVAEGDVKVVERIAHLLKGSMATLGAERAGVLVQRLEEMGRTGDLDDAATAEELFNAELNAVVTAVKAYAAGDKTTV